LPELKPKYRPSDESIYLIKKPIDKVQEISRGYSLARNLENIFPNLSIGRKQMRKRNKKTTIISRLELSGVTEHILAGMGEEGRFLRDRLMRFLEEKTISPQRIMGKIDPTQPADIT
jgi:hypothetical protein